MPMWVFGLNEEDSIVNTVKGQFYRNQGNGIRRIGEQDGREITAVMKAKMDKDL